METTDLASAQQLIEFTIPLTFEPIEIVDAKGGDSGQQWKSLRVYRAVGAVADMRYLSDRVIRAEVQQRGLERSKARQMTQFIGHPKSGIDVPKDSPEIHIGDIRDVAAIVEAYHYDPKTKQTILDRVRICDTKAGEDLNRLIDSGVVLGVSQRAAGRQQWKEFDGERLCVVEDILQVFGWDIVHLNDANAGTITKIQPLTDAALAALTTAEPFAEPLTDAELDEYAPLNGQRPKHDVIVDGAVAPQPGSAKAPKDESWSMTTAEQDKAPNSAFAWISAEYLSGKSKNKREGRKLPHHKGGKVVFKGVRAAMAALNGARGGTKIPASDRKGVYRHLAVHYRAFEVEPPALRDAAMENTTMPAVVHDENNNPGEQLAQMTVKLAEENVKLAAGIKGYISALRDDLQSRMSGQEAQGKAYQDIWKALGAACEEVEDIHESDKSAQEKNEALKKLGEELKSVLGKAIDEYMKAAAGEVEDGEGDEETDEDEGDKGGETTTDAKDGKEGKGGKMSGKGKDGKSGEAAGGDTAAYDSAARATELQGRASSTRAITDSFAAATQQITAGRKLRDNKAHASAAIAAMKLPEKVQGPVQELVDSFITARSTKEDIDAFISKKVVALIDAGRASQALAQFGIAPAQGVPRVETITDGSPVSSLGAPHLVGVAAITDSLLKSGFPAMAFPEAAKVPPKVQEILDQFDEINGHKLALEAAKISALRDQYRALGLRDAATTADFDYPYTLSRVALFETYAEALLTEMTDFGKMETDRSQVPISRWRRDDGLLSTTFNPTLAQQLSVSPAELTAVPKGKLHVDFFNIDAHKRALQASMSYEFLARAKRYPEVQGVALTMKNMVAEMQRILLNIHNRERIRNALWNGATAFNVSKNGDGTTTSFQVIGTTAANAVSIVHNAPSTPVVVTIGTGNQPVPEFGTSLVGGGPGGAFFYTIQNNIATINFVDVNGNALAPPVGTGNIVVTGMQATGEQRFNMVVGGGFTQGQWMQKLAFLIDNQRARMSEGHIDPIGWYDSDYVMASLTNCSFLSQADLYAKLFTRPGYNQPSGPTIKEGNQGVLAGMGLWASKLFDPNFIVVGDSKSVVFRIFEPSRLEGPFPTRDSSGALTAGHEYLQFQMDAIAVPIKQKQAAVTLYQM